MGTERGLSSRASIGNLLSSEGFQYKLDYDVNGNELWNAKSRGLHAIKRLVSSSTSGKDRLRKFYSKMKRKKQM